MDFDSLLYSLVIGGTIVWSVVKNFKKGEKQRQAQKERSQPIIVEPDDTVEEVRPKRQTTRVVSQPEPSSNEYFSYETMSERDFEQAFAENETSAEAATAATLQAEKPHINLSMDEEEVFKGVVWSEILKRKY